MIVNQPDNQLESMLPGLDENALLSFDIGDLVARFCKIHFNLKPLLLQSFVLPLDLRLL